MTNWIYADNNETEINNLSRFGLTRLAAAVVSNRRDVFTDDVLSGKKRQDPFYDPFLMKDMEKAVERINAAIPDEKITIYGDYDADGVTSTTILYLYLKSRGADVEFYIPDRMGEGYGLNIEALRQVQSDGTKLLITVDTGITAVEEVCGLEMDVIVTDHHEPKEKIPNCVAVINPKQADCGYPFKDLAGVGVVFKLIQALSGDVIDEYLPFVCLGTVADVMPLLDENREFVKQGLALFKASKNIGLHALISEIDPNNSYFKTQHELSDTSHLGKAANCGRDSEKQCKNITTGIVAFKIAPRINAAGRLGSADKCVEMFLSSNAAEAQNAANALTDENQRRQEIEKKIYEDAVCQVEELYKSDFVLVLASAEWHQGVIGIVASKIVEKYNKPALLISLNDGIGKGSGRSIRGLDLLNMLDHSSELLGNFGGHKLAAGLTIEEGNIEGFRDKLNDYAKKYVPMTTFFQRELTIDAKLMREDLNIKSIQQLKRLEPFGAGNPSPLFALTGVKINAITKMSGGAHVKINVDGIDAVGFRMGELAQEYNVGDVIDIAGTLEINEYMGNRKIQMLIKDVRRHG